MEPKQQVTIYLPTHLHKQLKIRAAIDQRFMSELTEQAVSFYLTNPEIVEANGVGHTHQVYNCPACSETLVIRKGELYAVGGEKTGSNSSLEANALDGMLDLEITDLNEQKFNGQVGNNAFK
jgi:hypothetical protein